MVANTEYSLVVDIDFFNHSGSIESDSSSLLYSLLSPTSYLKVLLNPSHREARQLT